MRVAIVVVFIALGLRLVAVQAFSSDHYAKIGASEVTSTVQVPAQRGGIFDRNGAVLAISVPRSDVVADPFLIRDPAGEARALAPVMGLTQPQLQAELSEHSGFVYLAQKVEQKVASQVKALDLVGITLLPDTERVDPAGQLATPLLGTVGSNGAGQAGLEYQFNKLLAGRNGSITEEQAPGGVLLLGGTTQRPAAKGGTGIELTIDQPLQYATEQSLGAAVTGSHAKSGIAVVMDTHTGDILAMANLVVDPKTRKLVEAGQNLALTQVYEPGSVFKAVTFSAALTDGIVAPSTVLTVPSSLTIDGWVFHDAENHPTEQLSATQILAQSSNIGTIEIAQALGKDRLAAQIGALGFGQPTGLGFPGESAGLVKKDASQWSASDIGGNCSAGARHDQHGGDGRGLRASASYPSDGVERRVGHRDSQRRRAPRPFTAGVERAHGNDGTGRAGRHGGQRWCARVHGRRKDRHGPDPRSRPRGLHSWGLHGHLCRLCSCAEPGSERDRGSRPAHADFRRGRRRSGVLPSDAIRTQPLRRAHLPARHHRRHGRSRSVLKCSAVTASQTGPIAGPDVVAPDNPPRPGTIGVTAGNATEGP
jgi:hypothetical protein